MWKSFLFLFIECTTLSLSVCAQNPKPFNPKEANYIWPTNASSYLTSTFAETRAGHFHAALDIKTWGRRGYKVFATRDGVIYRIAIGPHGYGKVIYLKHPDDSYSVYAHLLTFNNQLQKWADSIRFAEDYQFQIDRFIEDRQIKVKQGDVIGYTGASGIGPPHLHFELRTPSHKPFNPLLTNLSVPDNLPPKIVSISVEPLAPYSSIEGQNAIYTKRARKKNGEYHISNINVSGPVGLGINVFDRANRVYNAYAVYELSMSVDGKQMFSARVDSFSYQQTDQMFIDRVYPLLKEEGEGYQRLFVADGNSLSFYNVRDSKGKLNLKPGRHKVSISVTDYFGNTSKASTSLSVYERTNDNLSLSPRSTSTLEPWSALSPNDWQWFNNWVNIPRETFQQLTIATADSSTFINHGKDIALDMNEMNNLFMNSPATGPVEFHRLIPESVGVLGTVNKQAFALFPKHSFYDTVSAYMSVKQFKADSIRLDIIPGAYPPLRKDYKFYVKRDSNLTNRSKLSFYKWNGKYNRWRLVPTQFTEQYVIGKTNSFGTFASLYDTTAPTLRNPRITQRPDGQWLLMIHAEDNLSGIDYDRTKILVNGTRGIAEYEPEDSRLVYYHPKFTPSDTMHIEITAFDRMGNKTELTFAME